MLHLIQNNIFSDTNYYKLFEVMNKFDLDYQVVSFKPKSDELILERDINTDNVMCWGSVKFAHVGIKHSWKPGSFYNKETHDFEHYSKYYKENMLNADSIICKIKDDIKLPDDYMFFARPTQDTKSFTGRVFTHKAWHDSVNEILSNPTDRLNGNTVVQISREKEIAREIRVWVIKGKVVDASQYRINNQTIYEHCTEPYILEFAQKMVDIYQPADAFVIDVCMLPDGDMKIVEINCLNSAGFYHVDIQKLLMSIENNFG